MERFTNDWFGLAKATEEMEKENKDRGALFKNQRKTEDWHSDYQGNCTIDGVDYWINGYLNEKEDGEKFFGLSFKRKEK